MNYICCCFKKDINRRTSNRLTFSLAPRRRTTNSQIGFIGNNVLDDERPSIVSSKLGNA